MLGSRVWPKLSMLLHLVGEEREKIRLDFAMSALAKCYSVANWPHRMIEGFPPLDDNFPPGMNGRRQIKQES